MKSIISLLGICLGICFVLWGGLALAETQRILQPYDHIIMVEDIRFQVLGMEEVAQDEFGFGKSSPCAINVACDPRFQKWSKGVFLGNLSVTVSLLNNTKRDSIVRGQFMRHYVPTVELGHYYKIVASFDWMSPACQNPAVEIPKKTGYFLVRIDYINESSDRVLFTVVKQWADSNFKVVVILLGYNLVLPSIGTSLNVLGVTQWPI